MLENDSSVDPISLAKCTGDLLLNLGEVVRGVKAFRVSSLSSAAEQRRLFAMHFVLRSSGNTSRWKRRRGQTGGRGRRKREKSNQGDAPMIMTVGDNEMRSELEPWKVRCAS